MWQARTPWANRIVVHWNEIQIWCKEILEIKTEEKHAAMCKILFELIQGTPPGGQNWKEVFWTSFQFWPPGGVLVICISSHHIIKLDVSWVFELCRLHSGHFHFTHHTVGFCIRQVIVVIISLHLPELWPLGSTTNTSSVIWWPHLQPVEVAPPGGQNRN